MEASSLLNAFPGAVTICNTEGIILAMNDKSIKAFEDDGGADLIGQNVLDCHPEPARSKLADLIENEQANVYTIEKKGVKKLIYQALWYEDGVFAGIVEVSLEIPFEMPHFVRG
ncbi:MAG: diguanylate cyclase [Anaerolineae bacterium]|nr:diguanylate cyclase [Anaerolineae bacterium]